MNDQPGLFSLDDDPGPLNPKPRRPQEPIVREALVEDGCRYWLKRAWGAGPCILWVMCNPSDASATRDDPTMWRVMEFSKAWGYGSCIVVNPIPLISSTPTAALKWANKVGTMDYTYDDPTWVQWNANISHCTNLIDVADAHIAAWGNNVPGEFIRDWLQCLAESADGGRGGGAFDDDLPPIQWMCLGTTISGAPKHPLARGKHRIPPDFKPVPWKQN